jgi:hypothetical protein
MGVKGLKKKVSAKGKKQMLKFTIDCQQPADDTIIQPGDLGLVLNCLDYERSFIY